MAHQTTLVLVGGFLGAGKTRLLLKAAATLEKRGLRTAIITNDQGGELVDTRLATAAGHATEEISGGCFCCRFSDFINAAGRLLATQPDVIFAEPVGSCMDISATILQPIKQYYGDRFRVAPFTVLVDAARVHELHHELLTYLFRNQVLEADLVYFSKSDLYTTYPALPGGAAGHISAATGDGVNQWLGRVLDTAPTSGVRLLDIDYTRYAQAEAALGWLNLHARLTANPPRPPALILGPFLDDLDARLTAAGAAIMHLKVLDQSGSGYLRASLCRNGVEPTVEGDLTASPARRHELIVNLRALAAPELLTELVRQSLATLPGVLKIQHSQAFRPSPPVPEQRFDHVL